MFPLENSEGRGQMPRGTVQYLEGIRSGENCHKWHVKNCDARTNHPHFEVQAAEPIPLRRPRLDDKQPEAEFCRRRTRQYQEERTNGAHENCAFTFKVGYPLGTNG